MKTIPKSEMKIAYSLIKNEPKLNYDDYEIKINQLVKKGYNKFVLAKSNSSGNIVLFFSYRNAIIVYRHIIEYAHTLGRERCLIDYREPNWEILYEFFC